MLPPPAVWASLVSLVPLFAWDHSGFQEILSRWLATGLASLPLAKARVAWSHLMLAVLAVQAKVEVIINVFRWVDHRGILCC